MSDVVCMNSSLYSPSIAVNRVRPGDTMQISLPNATPTGRSAAAAVAPPLRLLQRWVPAAAPRAATQPQGWAAVVHAVRQLIQPR
jgi:hypothetical protein